MKITVLYVGSSLLAPLRGAESAINEQYALDLRVAAHNCGASLAETEWLAAKRDLEDSDIVFIIHVTDGENARRIAAAVDEYRERHRAVIAFNCMPELMRRLRLGKLDFSRMMKSRGERGKEESGHNLARKIGSWMADFIKGRSAAQSKDASNERSNGRKGAGNPGQYVKLINRLPALLKFVPSAGKLGDIKNYLYLFCYFLQPTPGNIRSMLLYAIKHYLPERSRAIKVDPAESLPAIAIYHPDAPALFESFADYRKWYERARKRKLDPEQTIGLLLMRPQVVSRTSRHYDGLIHAIEDEGLAVIPALSTFMDNRESCREFFVDGNGNNSARMNTFYCAPRVSQVVSLTGFSFVGGPAMNDSEAAVGFLKELNVPFRSLVSLDVQTIENWQASKLGLNPVQTAMQVAIPEIDGATEAFVFGGVTRNGNQPEPLEDRCHRIARRLARWNRLRIARRDEVRLACLIYCFPPNKGNIGTAADLDVFPSLLEILSRLKQEGYRVDLPESADLLRERLLGGNSAETGMIANVAYRMSADEYRRLCPYVEEIEREWGRAPGLINSNGREVFVLGIELGNIFVGVQPTFGYEGDPMRLLAAESGAPHHSFMATYVYLEKIFRADAVVHVGTHGAMEFMPGKQVGLSCECWPDRLIGELPNIYIYSVNNPSEGTIARRRSYAELVSYLTPPIENAGLYKELAAMKELLMAYRQAKSEAEREQLYEAIEEKAELLNL
ncbi:MAG: cobaltochelatase subunit CobN [Blastocatellia bacterium]|nr:cobaltochelatase subunit CobN [Blastocatellia bacterium]